MCPGHALVELGDISLRVVLQVFFCHGTPANMVLRAAFKLAWSSLAMNFGLRQCHCHPQYLSVTTGGDSHGHQYGAVVDLTNFAYALIA